MNKEQKSFRLYEITTNNDGEYRLSYWGDDDKLTVFVKTNLPNNKPTIHAEHYAHDLDILKEVVDDALNVVSRLEGKKDEII